MVERSADTVNPKLPTGEVELQIAELSLISEAEPLPFPVNMDAEYPEEMRLKYRFLDLRREQRAPQHHAALGRSSRRSGGA